MAVVSNVISVYAEAQQANGTTSTGVLKVKSIRLPALSTTNTENTKVYNVAQAYSTVLPDDDPVIRVETVSRSRLSNS